MQLHHLAIQVHDLDSAVRWYEELFALRRLKEWPAAAPEVGLRAVWLELAGTAFLALERCAGSAPLGGPWKHPDPGLHVAAFRIAHSERASWEARLAARGVNIDHRSPYSLFFRDPEGNRLAVSHHPEPQA